MLENQIIHFVSFWLFCYFRYIFSKILFFWILSSSFLKVWYYCLETKWSQGHKIYKSKSAIYFPIVDVAGSDRIKGLAARLAVTLAVVKI